MQKERSIYYDTLKGFLILLVVFGHLIELFIYRSPAFQSVYFAIYTFHMPLFILLAGLFSCATIDTKQFLHIFWRIIVPLVVFQSAYLLFVYVTQNSTPPWLTPYRILWFLLSLLCWRLMLPILAKFSAPLVCGSSVLIALWAGHNTQIGYDFSLSRTLYFLPFFCLGHFYGKPLIAFCTTHKKTLLFFSAVALLSMLYWHQLGLHPRTLYGSFSYFSISGSDTYPAVARGAILLFSFVISLGCLALFSYPMGTFLTKTFTYLGAHSLGIFLLHFFFVLMIQRLIALWGITPSSLTFMAFFLLSGILCFSCAAMHSLFKHLSAKKRTP